MYNICKGQYVPKKYGVVLHLNTYRMFVLK